MPPTSPGTEPAPVPAGDGPERPLRLVSWNVRSLRDDARAVEEGLRLLRPDVLALQEAPRFAFWRERLAGLARRAGLLYTCGGRTTGGSALLTSLRVDVASSAEWRLPRTAGQHQRGVAVADLRVGAATLRVASTHLGLTAQEREAHAAELLHFLRRGDTDLASCVLAGDINETAAGTAWQTLTGAGLRDAYPLRPVGGELTFSTASPRRRIDGVFVGAAYDVLGAGVADLPVDLMRRASDHFPVVADLVPR